MRIALSPFGLSAVVVFGAAVGAILSGDATSTDWLAAWLATGIAAYDGANMPGGDWVRHTGSFWLRRKS